MGTGNIDALTTKMEASFLEHRAALMSFFRSRNVGDDAEDLLHELWIRLPKGEAPIHTPLSYMYRMANSLIIDRHRRSLQDRQRNRDWVESMGVLDPGSSDRPRSDHALEAREIAEISLTTLANEGGRVLRAFTLHRIDGLTQREVARILGVSIGTVEGDLRRAYRALLALRELTNEE